MQSKVLYIKVKCATAASTCLHVLECFNFNNYFINQW